MLIINRLHLVPPVVGTRTRTQHGVHKRARDGNIVYYEKLGKINIHKLREEGVSLARLVRYYIYQVRHM